VIVVDTSAIVAILKETPNNDGVGDVLAVAA
jgi:uncharacterized protein with PIN domain